MKYIKKAVVIDAIQVKANNFDRICDFMGCTPEQVLNPMSDIDIYQVPRENMREILALADQYIERLKQYDR